MQSDNGSKIDNPKSKDYVVLSLVQQHSLQITLDMYSQDEWELESTTYSGSALYTLIFRRKLESEPANVEPEPRIEQPGAIGHENEL